MNALPLFTAAEVAAWSGGEWSCPPTSLRGVVSDSRALTPGCLFLALRGERFDGHEFVAAAAAAGAVGALVASDFPAAATTLPLLRVDDTHAALTRLARGYRRKTSARIIGLTGSAGKTTVKEITAHLLQQAGCTACTRGNWNNAIGLPLSMLSMPREADFGVFEVGTNHPGEIEALCRTLSPESALVTNVGPAHIEFFGSEAAIADEKADLLRAIPAEGIAVLDADSAWYPYLAAQTRGRRVTVSLAGRDADLSVVAWDAVQGRCDVRDRGDGGEYRLEPGYPGAHTLVNALLATAMARVCGVPWPAIQAALPTAPRAPMRWEVLTLQGVTVINDAYNANPLSMRRAIDTFDAAVQAPRRYLLLGDMLEIGDSAPAEHAALGERIAGMGWSGLLTVGRLGAEIAAGALRGGMGGSASLVASFESAERAGAALAEILAPGDALLLKGSRGMRLERALALLSGASEEEEGSHG